MQQFYLILPIEVCIQVFFQRQVLVNWQKPNIVKNKDKVGNNMYGRIIKHRFSILPNRISKENNAVAIIAVIENTDKYLETGICLSP